MFTAREARIHDRHLDPLEDDRPIYCTCFICGEEILDGDEYYEIADYNVCESCIEDAHTYASVS